MTRFRLSLSLALAGSAAACHPDAVTNSPIVPSAGINFANAVPDTNKMIFRVVDIPANAVLAGATFRSANNYPIGITAGTRRIRVFFDTTDVMLAQTVLIDTTYTFVQDQHYSFLAAGFARAGKT